MEKWSKLIESGIEKGGLLLLIIISYFLVQKGFMTDPSTGKEFSITDYDPLANEPYVTQITLKSKDVPVSPEVKDHLNHLQAGEFGLLLPEKLKGQEEEMNKRYEDYLSPRDDQGKYHLINEGAGNVYSESTKNALSTITHQSAINNS